MIRKTTVDIVKELVTAYLPQEAIKTVVDNLNGTFTITVCELYNTRKGLTIKVNGIDYTVSSFNGALNTVTYASGVAPVVGQIFKPPIVFFFHGTPFATALELKEIQNVQSKMPMVYLYEVLTDRMITNVDSTFDRESELRIFFMDESDFANWDTDKHYSETIIPMWRYATNFLDSLKKNKFIGKFDDYSLTYHAKFGMVLKNAGHESSLFAEEMSGVEVQINLPISKNLACVNDC